VNVEVISPAASIPKKIIIDAFLISIFKKLATKAPVQPPVPGRGIATKINSPQKLAVSSPLLFFSAFSSSFSTRRRIFKKFVLFMNLNIF